MIRNGYMYGRRIGELYRIIENGHLPLLVYFSLLMTLVVFGFSYFGRIS
ncbi:hypothetical protein T4D_11424 [Trichinella pseudospiralis]|uniref:Uncharacterized protein n=1 Tax=Trichinella pseudospiralis TaxID=6337 RepID=A0A0V1DRK5_TRIPS|nr:hypothetical protein T4D_11424 [Trichinella pseudospiralis]